MLTTKLCLLFRLASSQFIVNVPSHKTAKPENAFGFATY